MELSETPETAMAPKRGRIILLRVGVIAAVLGFFVFLFAVTLGPPTSVDTLSCEVEEDPKVSHTRRNISYSVETSCGKLGLEPQSYWRAQMELKVGESYDFTVENRLFGRRAVAFEAS